MIVAKRTRGVNGDFTNDKDKCIKEILIENDALAPTTYEQDDR